MLDPELMLSNSELNVARIERRPLIMPGVLDQRLPVQPQAGSVVGRQLQHVVAYRDRTPDIDNCFWSLGHDKRAFGDRSVVIGARNLVERISCVVQAIRYH